MGARVTSFLLASSVVLVACSSGSHRIASNTPRITVAPNGADGSAQLLTREDLTDALNWTITIERDLNDVPLFENPDTRGPCGGKSPAIPTTGAVGRAFESREAQIVELLVPWSSETATFLAAQQQDRDVVPCGPFTSITNQGIEQRATNVHVVRMPKHPSAVVSFADISVQDQQATMGLVSTRTGKYLALVMIIGSRASDSAARTLVDKLTTAKP